MKKVIKLTETQLKKVIAKIIEEQSMVFKSQTFQQKPSSGRQSSVGGRVFQSSQQDWYNKFPCLSKTKKLSDGTLTDNSNNILLPETGIYDNAYQKAIKRNRPYNEVVGQVKDGGVYFCTSETPNRLIVIK